MNKNIVLIGFMGTLKSSLGYRLAIRTHMGFLDTQAYIEDRENRLVAQFSGGPKLYNSLTLERQALEIITRYDNMVVACGTNISMDDYAMARIRETSYIIWLDCELETILERASGREPLNSMTPRQIEQFYWNHIKVFESWADMKFDTAGEVDYRSLDKMAHRLHQRVYMESLRANAYEQEYAHGLEQQLAY